MAFATLKAALCLYSHLPLGNLSGGNLKLYSTAARPGLRRKSWKNPLNELYRRISPVGDRRVSIVPILDQWVEEGRDVNKFSLTVMIKELRYYKRYDHALQISMWMTDKRYYELTSRDFAIRLDLIAKVHGIEEAESFFNNIPNQQRVLEVYGALLNSYAHVKDVVKAEATIKKMKDLGFTRSVLACNVLLNLYYQTENYDKVDILVHQMKEEGFKFDKFTYGIRFSSYAANSNIEAIDQTLTEMESDPESGCDWGVYAIAANAYTKLGLVEKALSLLKKCEEFLTTRKSDAAFNFILTQYAAIGKKEEVLRLWEIYRKQQKIYNKGYMSVITSLLKFDDIENAEKILEDWECKGLAHDIRIPNFVIGAYCRKGLLEKAETLFNRIQVNGPQPDALSWYFLATGYLLKNQTSKAVEYMKEAISVCGPGWRLSDKKDILAACLEYMRGHGDVEGAEKLVRLLRAKDLVSLDIHDRLLNWIKDKESGMLAIHALEEETLVGNGETIEVSEVEDDTRDIENTKDFFVKV
ncbi:Pentatricopeptide repeat-containing protein [Quillaja saponaria]|uniref:Pentatricopeptide repeat-containing protein n=1 Tax=Quillaja saponaria TaxID=32244 RepID=A0AAD7VHR4_QUISA|nr:Pentatricopeptide repeat-containing protein [Quillaja saponaria]